MVCLLLIINQWIKRWIDNYVLGLYVGREKATDEPMFNGSEESQPTNGSQRILTVSKIGYEVSNLWTSFDVYYLNMLLTHLSQCFTTRNFYQQN